MSLYVEMSLNTEWLGTVSATRITSNGSQPDDVNTYDIRMATGGSPWTVGQVEHRFGDGAAVLAHAALGVVIREARTVPGV